MKKLLLVFILLVNSLNPLKASADEVSISISNISVDKTALNAGSQLTVTFNMSSSNFTIEAAQKNQVFIYKNDLGECDDGECPLAGAVLTSGSVSNGNWRATLTIPSSTISGSYTPVVFFAGLKGTPGNIGYGRNLITIMGTSAKPFASPAPANTLKPSSKPSPTTSANIKKITITCVKGKVSKKVTAVKPICPPGYKKK